MKKRKWLSKDKLKIVLEGLSGNIEISKLCSKYQLSQTVILPMICKRPTNPSRKHLRTTIQ